MAKKLTPEIKAGLERAEQAVAEKTAKSKQPRFSNASKDEMFYSFLRWHKEAFQQIPEYQSDSRTRSKWMNSFWHNEPYLAGVINSAVQIDRNRGWSLIGGRNQVLRFSSVLHNWQVQPGRASWRDGVGAMAQGFYTMDIGGMVEVGRQFKDGPLAGLFHIDPTRCVMTPNIDYPMKYYPSKALKDGRRMVEFGPYDFMRAVSQINVDEGYNSLGYCALSRAMELGIILTAIMRHEQELLFARAAKGLLLLKGITQKQWNDAMTVRDAALDGKEQEWFGSVSVLASLGVDDIDAKLIGLSQLPEGFDQQTYTDLIMYGYALCFGFDPREFWPVSSGNFGTSTETETQHRKATGKGGHEFMLAFQEELQGNLPETLHFEFDERDAEGEMLDAELRLKQVEVVQALTGGGAMVTLEQGLQLLAENGVIPREWAENPEIEATAVEETPTDEEDAPEEETDDTEEAPDEAERAFEMVSVQRAMQAFPNEPIVKYDFPSGKIRELSRKTRKYFIMRASDDVLYGDDEVVITGADVDAAIDSARRRTPGMGDLLDAEPVPDEEEQAIKPKRWWMRRRS